ncbi:MAG: hypothetical protein M3N54_08315, partial [Acidobacteriota bacterium]|nr:hypothetical protein [Acidobacteriota bacterium]
ALGSAVVYTSRRTEWRGVSFGLCWFLIALAPAALIPGRMVESNARMFLPFIGLALACTRAGSILVSRLAETTSVRGTAFASSFLLAALVLSAAGWSTFQRNKIWNSEDSLWQGAVQMSPQNGRAWTHAGEAAIADFDYRRGLESLQRAEPLVAGSARLETDLALAFDLAGNADATQKHFKLAIAAGPRYARAYSSWGQWLNKRQRLDEAFAIAGKAATIEPTDVTAQHTLLDIYSQQFNWVKVKETARNILAIYPRDQAGQTSLLLAQTTLDAVDRIENSAEGRPTPQEYLKLSVFYFQSKRYEDSIAASRSALKINDQLGEAWANIAAAQHEMGKDDDAIASLRQVIRLRPDLTFANKNLDYLLAKRSQTARK